MVLKHHSSAACAVFLACALFLIPATGWSQGIGKMKPKAAPKEDKVPSDLTPGKVDGYIAGLTDAQARKVLISELKAKAAARQGKDKKEEIGAEETGLVFAF